MLTTVAVIQIDNNPRTVLSEQSIHINNSVGQAEGQLYLLLDVCLICYIYHLCAILSVFREKMTFLPGTHSRLYVTVVIVLLFLAVFIVIYSCTEYELLRLR